TRSGPGFACWASAVVRLATACCFRKSFFRLANRPLSKRQLGDAKLTSPVMMETEIFSVIGEAGFTRLVGAFYRQVTYDAILGKMSPSPQLAAAEQRLCDFLIYRFGGPQRYIEQRGHPRLRARHLPFRIDQAARDRWMQLMDNAFAEVALPAEA